MLSDKFTEALHTFTPHLGRCLVRCLHRRVGRDYSANENPTLNETLGALKRLKLAGRYYEPSDLFRAIEGRLSLDLSVQEIGSEAARRGMSNNGIRGALLVVPELERADLIVPDGLDPEELMGIMYHELAHIVAGHALPCKRPGDEGSGLWIPPHRFTKRKPPFDLSACQKDPELMQRYLAWCEADAESWAENLRICGAHGARVFFRQEILLGL